MKGQAAKVHSSDVRLYEQGSDIAKKVIRMSGKMSLDAAANIAKKYPSFHRAEMNHYAVTKGGDSVTISNEVIYE